MNSSNEKLVYDLLNQNFFTLRSIFYLLKPSETYYENVNDVPDFTEKAVNIFFSFILVEYLINVIKFSNKNRGNLGDSITSIGSGMMLFLPNWFFRKISYVSYEWVYEKFNIYELPYDSVWTFFITILLTDMLFYWFHRATHEISLFWAAHQMHHSSDEYNLTVALRKSVFQVYIGWIFYLPMALFIRPSTFIVHSHLNLIYQFWIHTELIESLGPLEYILNTPSHHRVHHGRNSYCIDKNYAGVFIIWDRLFGTFAGEKKNEDIAYGLIHPVQTFDPFYLQTFNYIYLFKKCLKANSINEINSILFKGPGWTSSGVISEYPKIENPIKKHFVPIPKLLNIYVFVHFVCISLLFTTFSKNLNRYPSILLSIFVIYILISLTSFGAIFDGRKHALIYETLRCLASITLNYVYRNELKMLFKSDIFYIFYNCLNLISIVALLSYKKFIPSNKLQKNS